MFFLLQLWLVIVEYLEQWLKEFLRTRGFDCDTVKLSWFCLALFSISNKELDLYLESLTISWAWSTGIVVNVAGTKLAIAQRAAQPRKFDFTHKQTNWWLMQRAKSALVIWLLKRFTLMVIDTKIVFTGKSGSVVAKLESLSIHGTHGAFCCGNLLVDLVLDSFTLQAELDGEEAKMEQILQPFFLSVAVSVASQEIKVGFACSKAQFRVIPGQFVLFANILDVPTTYCTERNSKALWRWAVGTIRAKIHAKKRALRQPQIDALVANRIASKDFAEFHASANRMLLKGEITQLPQTTTPPPFQLTRRVLWESDDVVVNLELDKLGVIGLHISECHLDVDTRWNVVAKLDHVVLTGPNDLRIELNNLVAGNEANKSGMGITSVALHRGNVSLIDVEWIQLARGTGTISIKATVSKIRISDDWDSFENAVLDAMEFQSKLTASAVMGGDNCVALLQIPEPQLKTVAVKQRYQVSSDASLAFELVAICLGSSDNDNEFVVGPITVACNGRCITLRIANWGKREKVVTENDAVQLHLQLPAEDTPFHLELQCTRAHFAMNQDMVGMLARLRGPAPPQPPPPHVVVHSKTSFLPAQFPDHVFHVTFDECTFSLGQHLALTTSFAFNSTSATAAVVRKTNIQFDASLLHLGLMEQGEDEGITVDFPPFKVAVQEQSHHGSSIHMHVEQPITIQIDTFVRPVSHALLLMKIVFPYPAPPPPPMQFAYEAKYFPNIDLQWNGLKVCSAFGTAEWRGIEILLGSVTNTTFSSIIKVHPFVVSRLQHAGGEDEVLLRLPSAVAVEEEDFITSTVLMKSEQVLDMQTTIHGGELLLSYAALQDFAKIRTLFGEIISPQQQQQQQKQEEGSTTPLFTCAVQAKVLFSAPLQSRVMQLECGIPAFSLNAFTSASLQQHVNMDCSVYASLGTTPLLKPLELAAQIRGQSTLIRIKNRVEIEISTHAVQQIREISHILATPPPPQPTSSEQDNDLKSPPAQLAAVASKMQEYKIDFDYGASLNVCKQIHDETLSMVGITLFDFSTTCSKQAVTAQFGVHVTTLADQFIDPFHMRIEMSLLPDQTFLPKTAIKFVLLKDFNMNLSKHAVDALTWLQTLVTKGEDDGNLEQRAKDVFALAEFTSSGRAFLLTNHSSDVIYGHLVERDEVSLREIDPSTVSASDNAIANLALRFTARVKHFNAVTRTWGKCNLRMTPLLVALFDVSSGQPLQVISTVQACVAVEGDLDVDTSSSSKRATRAVSSFQIVSPHFGRHRFIAESPQQKLNLLLIWKKSQASLALQADQFAKFNLAEPERLTISRHGGGKSRKAAAFTESVFAVLLNGILAFYSDASKRTLMDYCDLSTALAVIRPSSRTVSIEFPGQALLLEFDNKDGGDDARMRKWESALAETLVLVHAINQHLLGRDKPPCFSTMFPIDIELQPKQVYQVMGHSKAIVLGTQRADNSTFRAELFVTRETRIASNFGSCLQAHTGIGDSIVIRNTVLLRNEIVNEDELHFTVSVHRALADTAEECFAYMVTNTGTERSKCSWTVGGDMMPEASVAHVFLDDGESQCFFLDKPTSNLAFVCTNDQLKVEWIETRAMEAVGSGQMMCKRGELLSLSGRFQIEGHVTMLRINPSEDCILLPFQSSIFGCGRRVPLETLSHECKFALLRSANEFILVNAVIAENRLPFPITMNDHDMIGADGGKAYFACTREINLSKVQFALNVHSNVKDVAFSKLASLEDDGGCMEQTVAWRGGSALCQVYLGNHRDNQQQQQPSQAEDSNNGDSNSANTSQVDNDNDDEEVEENKFRFPIRICFTYRAKFRNCTGDNLLVRTNLLGEAFVLRFDEPPVTFASAADIFSVQFSAILPSTQHHNHPAAVHYSTAFPLLEGSNGIVEIAGVDLQALKYAISIEANNSVTIDPFYTLVNECKCAIELFQVREGEEDDNNARGKIIRLEPNSEPMPFHPVDLDGNGAAVDSADMYLRARKANVGGGFSLPFRLDIVVDTLLCGSGTGCEALVTSSRYNSVHIVEDNFEDEGDCDTPMFAVSVSFAQQPRLVVSFVESKEVATTASNRYSITNLCADAIVSVIETKDLGSCKLPVIIHPGDVVENYVFAHADYMWTVCVQHPRDSVQVDMSHSVTLLPQAQAWLLERARVGLRVDENALGRGLVIEDLE